MEENRRIIIVDDEPEALKGYAAFLSPQEEIIQKKSSRRQSSDQQGNPSVHHTYNLFPASSGEAALEIAKKEVAAGNPFAAGFFDVKLGPGMDGLATIQAIKALQPDIHCVVVTAYQDRNVDDINKLFGDDFRDQWDYLNKPFTQGEIVQKARQMVSAWNRKKQIEFMHQQLVKTERLAAIGQVARGVGHEFGNILLRIMGKADLALMEKDAQKIQEHISVILKAAERAGVIVKNLQTFSKAEPRFQEANIIEPIEEALSLVNHELVKASVKAEKKVQDTPKINIDVGAIAQVFLNMMINATHAMPKGGTLTISVEPAKSQDGRDGVLSKIKDTGTGIPDDVVGRIFDYAFTTKGDKGSGLGLSVSKNIIDTHKGTITVQTKVNSGTEFSIWIPKSHD